MKNIMPDSIFDESMRLGITCSFSYLFAVCLFSFFFVFLFVFFLFSFYWVILLFSSGWKRLNQFDHDNISGRGEILNYNRLRHMGLIGLQWDLKSETCQGISDLECHCWVPLSFYGVLFFTRDVAFLFNTIYLRCVTNGF